MRLLAFDNDGVPTIAVRRGDEIVVLSVAAPDLPRGIPGLLAPGAIPPEVVNRDILVMLALTLGLFIMGRSKQTHGTINRLEGGLLLSCFIAYQGWIVWQAHAAAI